MMIFYLATKHQTQTMGGDETQPMKTTAKARTTAKTTADFSTAAAKMRRLRSK